MFILFVLTKLVINKLKIDIMDEPVMISTYVAFRTHALEEHGLDRMLLSLCFKALEYDFTIAEMKKTQLTTELVEFVYEEHRDKPFYPKLVESMTTGPVCLVRVELPLYPEDDVQDLIDCFREYVVGATDPNDALPGTMRSLFGSKADYRAGLPYNACHSPNSAEAIRRELPKFFDNDGHYTLPWLNVSWFSKLSGNTVSAFYKKNSYLDN